MSISLGKHKSVIIFVCLCAVSLILSFLTVRSVNIEANVEPYNDPPRVKRGLSVFVAPANLCSSVISVVSFRLVYLGSVFTSLWRKPVEAAELEGLRSEVEELKRRLDEERERSKRLEELYKVYTRLTDKVEAEPGAALRIVAARVIAVEPTDWFRYLTIDKGRSDGLDVDMAVITHPEPHGLTGSPVDPLYLTGAAVGRIANVQQYSARVQLITDRLSVVAVTIKPLGDLVLLRGRPETENCVIDDMPSTAHEMLEAGQDVISDERSSIFPPGLLVGRISSVEKGIHFCRIEVQPAFKFSKLREMMVILDGSIGQ